MGLTAAPLPVHYTPRLVALSILIGILAAGAALDFAGRVTGRQGRARVLWLVGGGVLMGVGMWSMHSTGMLAFDLPLTVYFHLPTEALSLLAAILASVVALYVASRDRLTPGRTLLGSFIMGGGIVAMHYIGISAMRAPVAIHESPGLVAASVLVALGVSAVALRLTFRHGHAEVDDWGLRKVTSAVVMGLAISGMHYTGMAAASFNTVATPLDLAHTISRTRLGADAIALGTLAVLLVAIGSSVMDRRLMLQSARLQSALAEVRTLRGLLPICAYCKQVLTDQGAWLELESYVKAHTEATFSHGICPACEHRLVSESEG